MVSVLGDGRDASKFDKVAHKVEVMEYLKELNATAKDIRKFAKDEGVQALWVRVNYDEGKVARREVISGLAKGTGVTLIDPTEDDRYKALRHASKVRTLHDEKKERGKVTGERYLFWVKNEESGDFYSRVAALNDTAVWYTGWVSVRVNDATYRTEIMRDPLAGTEGTLAGYIQGVEWAHGLQGPDTEEILGKAAKLTGLFQAQMVSQQLMKGPEERIAARIMKRKVVGNDAYAWTLMVAEEDTEVQECLAKFNWNLFQEEVGAKRKVVFYTKAPEYIHQQEAGKKAREEYTKSRSDPEVEARTVVVFGSKKSQAEIEGETDKLVSMAKLALTSCGFKDDQISVGITVFTSRAGMAVVKVLLDTAEQANLVAVEQMGFKAVLGERATARISEVAQGAADKKKVSKPTYRQAAEQAMGSAGEMERKMETVAKRQMESIAVAIREGVRTEIAAQVELETKARVGAITWVQEQYAVALRDSEERTEKRLVSVEQTSVDTVAKLNAAIGKMEGLQIAMMEAVGRMEAACMDMQKKSAPEAAPANQQPAGTAPAQDGAAPALFGSVPDDDGKGMDCDDEIAAGQEPRKRERSNTVGEMQEVQSGGGQAPPASVQKPPAAARDEAVAQGEKKARKSDEQAGDTVTGGRDKGDEQ